MQDYEFEQYTVRLHIANLHFLTNIPIKYQPPTPYSLKDMGQIDQSHYSKVKGQIKVIL